MSFLATDNDRFYKGDGIAISNPPLLFQLLYIEKARKIEDMKRILVSLPLGAWSIIEREYKNKLGLGESETIRWVILKHLEEHGYLDKKYK